MISRELIFRVFVSSTFSDLVAERNALQEHVFPRLREFCQKHGARFQAIDLRWGISNEAALDQSTMRICRAEIARCQAVTPRPNFVVLLGDRHGWRPLPDEIPAAEFEALLPHLPAELAKRWYKLDENAVCPLPSGTGRLDKGQYVLQPRTGEFTDYDRWFDEVEGPLGDAFHRAARELGLPEAARLKYEASATAQEIHDGVFAVPEAREHVVAFVREIRTRDGRPLREALPGDAALKDFVDLKKGTEELDRESQDQLDALKQRLRDRLGAERIKTYSARWTGTGTSTEHVQQLCEDVYRALEQLISAQIERHRAMPPLEDERLRHQEFAQRRARDFTGQAGPLAEIERYLSPTSEPTAPLVVHGASGSGKSALLAKTVADHQSRYAHYKLVFRFIGATANSTDPRSLLEGLCRELGERYGADNTDLPLELNKLIVVFRQRLELATAEHPLALFLDALDQLQVADRPEPSWLPDKLPAHVRLVASAIPGPILDSLRSHLPSVRLLELGPMRPEDAAELLQKWLQRAGRRLTPEKQRQAVRAGFTRCSLPLYLRLAFEEAQRWRSYDTPLPPSPDVDGLIERLFHHLSEQLHHEPLLVERAISFLRCSRYGLTEDEILDLLARDDKYWERFLASAHHALPVTDGQQTRRLPIVIWSRLYHDLEPYLSWRSADGTALMVFFHTRFNEVADRQFLCADTVRHARHHSMATYFLEKADPEHNQSWKGKEPRPFLHVIFHLAGAGAQRLDELCQTLCDFRFIEARCEYRQVLPLISDYRLTQDSLPEARANETLAAFGQAIGREAETLADYPHLTRQQLCNRLRFISGPVCQIVEAEISRRSAQGGAWIELRAPIRESSGLITTFQAHDGVVWNCAVSPDGKLFASVGMDGAVKIWSADTFNRISTLRHDELADTSCMEQLRTKLLDRSRGSADWVETAIKAIRRGANQIAYCAFDSSSTLLAVKLYSDTLVVWDAYNGNERWSSSNFVAFIGRAEINRGLMMKSSAASMVVDTERNIILAPRFDHFAAWDIRDGTVLGAWQIRAAGFAVSPDSSAIVVAELDSPGRVFALDPRTGESALLFLGGEDGLRSCAVVSGLPMVITGGANGQITVRNTRTGTVVSTRNDHEHGVWLFSATQDGRYLITNDAESLKVWTLPELGEHASIRGLQGPVALSPDSKFLVCRCLQRSGELTVLELASGEEITRLVGHSGSPRCYAYTPDGSRIISGDDVGTVRVWNARISDISEPSTDQAHFDYIRSITFTADGQTLATADDTGRIQLWDANTLVRKATFESEANTKWAMGPDGSKLVSVSKGVVKLLDATSGGELASLAAPGVDYIYYARCSISPDGQLAAIVYEDGGILIWDLKTLVSTDVEERFLGVSSDCAFSPDARWLLTREMSMVSVRSVDTGIRRGGTLDPAYLNKDLTCFAVSPGGDFVVSGDDEGRVRIWDWPPDSVTAGGNIVNLLPSLEIRASTAKIIGCNVGVGGRIIAFADNKGMVRIWDARNGAELGALPVPGVSCIALHPLKPLLVVGTYSGEIHFADLRLMPSGARSETADTPQSYFPIFDGPRPIRAVPKASQPDSHLWLQRMDATLSGQWNRKQSAEAPILERNQNMVEEKPSTSPGKRQTHVLSRNPYAPVYHLMPHLVGDPNRAARLNIEYQEKLAAWEALPWWKRWRTSKPQPPEGI